MSKSWRAAWVPAALAILAVVSATGLAACGSAEAGDKLTGRIDLEAKLVPADLGPGGKGTLVIKGTLLEHHHIFAKGEQAMKYEAIPAAGVTYEMAKASITDPHDWKNEEGDLEKVWEETFTFEVPITLSEDAKPGTEIGVRFSYWGCTDRGCYPEVKNHAATLKLPGSAGPVVSPAATYEEGEAAISVDAKTGEIVLTFAPSFGWHFYGPQDDSGSTKIAVSPRKAEGVTWGKFVLPPAKKIQAAYTVRVPFKRTQSATELALEVTWAGCEGDDMTGRCNPPRTAVFKATWPGADGTVPPGVVADAAGGAGPNAPALKKGPSIVILRDPAPTPDLDDGDVTFDIDEAKSEAVITLAPAFGWHMYGPDHKVEDNRVRVEPVKAMGVTWGEFALPPAEEITLPYVVRVPFERAEGAREIAIKVSWLACKSGAGGICGPPHKDLVTATWGGPGVTRDVPVARPAGEVLFPVVEDDELGGGEDEQSTLNRLWRDSPILFFGLLFVIGLGLAFTPCVLPIIPITVSVISGGNADIPRKRLAALLGIYVLGLCLTFATMGVIAAQTGGAMSALFAMPEVQWGIAILFLVLGFGMFGVFELQPPAWLMKLQGGAQKRSGSFIGAFLFGILGAIIASPCTGPAIAALLIISANEGSVLLGFSMFFLLGLGMGAVLFAAGSLNFMLRPGPWMTWVRFSFGILIVAAAMYYLRNYQLIDELTMWIVGLAVCVLAAVGIAWHLHKREGEEIRLAGIRGAKVGALTALALALVAWYTRVPDDLLSWTYAKSPEHLQQLVTESQEHGKPVVVDFWGTWCTNCKVYDKRIASTPRLRERFEQITRIKVDLSDPDDQVRWPMRHALGIESSGAPVMVFIDRQGRIRRKADLVGLEDDDVVAAKIDLVLNETKRPIKTSAR